MDAPTGPYLIVACLCEKVLIEQDGVNSLVRIVDQITHHGSGPDLPEQMPPVKTELYLVVNLKPGRTKGSHQIVLRLVKPDGTVHSTQQVPVAFHGGEDQGASLNLLLKGEYDLEGLYWFEIYWKQVDEGSLLTKVPLRIIYLRSGPVTPQIEPSSSS